MTEAPFIHMFKTPMGFYLFDVNTNQIVSIDEGIYDHLCEIEAGRSVPATALVSEKLDLLIKKGYLLSYRPAQMRHPHDSLLHYHLNSNIEQVTLQLTQACNFRCAYCAYATPDFSTQRQHSPKRMTRDMAYRIVDFLAEHSANREHVSIGFYGGEPLLEKELLFDTVRYAEQALEGKSILFTITTNGTLFTQETMQFLSEHNFSVVISLDGTAEMHDRSRKFAADGSGTYSSVVKNLYLIKTLYPALYKKISINSVVDPRYGCQEMHDMFSKDDLFSGILVRATIIDDTFSMEKVFQSEQYTIENNTNLFKVIMCILGKYPKENISKVSMQAIEESNDKLLAEMTVQNQLPAVFSHAGPCIPGQRRLFVNVDGIFFPCERVNEVSPAMSIGDIDHGFDYEKAGRLLNIVELTASECRDCWAITHCTLCAKYCDNNGELSADFKRRHCAGVKRAVDEKFKDSVMLHELIQRYKVLCDQKENANE